METVTAFKEKFAFLEKEFDLPLKSFDYSEDFFGNIIAIYGDSDFRVRIVRDRGLLETDVSPDGKNWVSLDSVLEKIGEKPSVHLKYKDEHDYYGYFVGNDVSGQAEALLRNLPEIKKHVLKA